jgi:cytoskeletal protein CcmA (bactofilin family)
MSCGFPFHRRRFGLPITRAAERAEADESGKQESQLGYFSQGKADNEKDGLNGTGGTARQGEDVAVVKSLVKNMVKPKADTISTLGSGMLITGNIVCEGAAQIFGRLIGDIQAVEVIIGEGAKVEGNITAHEVGITGAFKGTIRGNNVRLKGAAAVDGEIFSKSLTVEENVLFEGLSRRLDRPIELPTCAQASGEKPLPAPAPAAAPAQAPAPALTQAPTLPATTGSAPISEIVY